MAAGLLALPFGTAHAAETPVHDTSQAALAQSQLRDVTGRVTDRATGDPRGRSRCPPPARSTWS